VTFSSNLARKKRRLEGNGRQLHCWISRASNFLDVPKIALARLFRLGIIFRVVVAVRETKAALVKFGNDLLGVVWVLRRASREDHGFSIDQLQTSQERSDLFCGTELGDRVEV